MEYSIVGRMMRGSDASSWTSLDVHQDKLYPYSMQFIGQTVV